MRVRAPNTEHAQLLGNLSRELNLLLVSPALPPTPEAAAEANNVRSTADEADRLLRYNVPVPKQTQSTTPSAKAYTISDVAAALEQAVHAAEAAKAKRVDSEELEDELFRAQLQTRISEEGTDLSTIERSLAFSRCDDLRHEGRDSVNSVTALLNTDVRIVAPDATGCTFANITISEANITTEITGGSAHSPLRLHGLKLVERSGRSVLIDDFVHHEFDLPMPDTGASLVCLGLANYEALKDACDGAVEVSTPGARAVTSVRGVGGVSTVKFHVNVRLDFGGRLVTVRDVPVLPSFRGFLLGNDLLNPCRAEIKYLPRELDGRSFDGYLQLFDAETAVASSEPLHFTCVSQVGVHTLETQAFECIDDETPTAEDPTAARRAALLKEASPIAFAPEPVTVPAWGRRTVYCRAPAAAVGDKPLCVVPLEDPRRAPVGVDVVPEFVTPDRNGYVPVTLINSSSRKRSLSLLAPLARFLI